MWFVFRVIGTGNSSYSANINLILNIDLRVELYLLNE
jgi:hypothetical protein